MRARNRVCGNCCWSHQFLGPQVADEHRVQRQPGRPQAVHPGDDLLDRVRAVRAVQREVQGEAFEAYVLDGGVQLPELLLLDAVPPHRAHALDDDPGAHQGVHPVHRRHGTDDPVGQGHRLLTPPERREHQQIAAEPVLDPGCFVGGADRERVGTETDRLVGQPFVAEAVPVALADRYEPGELIEHGFLVRPPARGVDVQGERHGRSGTFLVAAVYQRCEELLEEPIETNEAGFVSLAPRIVVSWIRAPRIHVPRISGGTCRCRAPCAAAC